MFYCREVGLERKAVLDWLNLTIILTCVKYNYNLDGQIMIVLNTYLHVLITYIQMSYIVTVR